MTAVHVCPQCGKPLSSDAPHGLCPQCLLKAALPGQSTLGSAPPAANAAQAGAHLKYFGDYELLEEIAHGGMGVVWKARQTSLNREVALKMIRAGALATPEEVQRFLREAEAAANLQHPNIVAIHEIGEHAGQHYFSMDYVSGRDLEALVKNGPLAPRRAASYLKIIAEAIHFAHQRGTLHRDLKPQNVLIDAADQPRITDFGLAKITKDDSRLTQTGTIMGSPSYMSPEQAGGRGGDIGPASDVYSLGAMLYELLTGRPPFRGTTALATLQQVLEVEPTAPRKLKADIPVDLETICLKCLEKPPSARYATARACAEELGRFLNGEPILARPASRVRKVVSWGRRHPGVLAALAALAMMALACGTYYLYEENAYLRFQQTNPNVVRVKPGDVLEPGKIADFNRPRSEARLMWQWINFMAIGPGILFLFSLWLRSRGLAWKDLRERDRTKTQVAFLAPAQPLGERTRTLALCVGLFMMFCGGMLLVKSIQATVWEGASGWGSVLPIYATTWFGLSILGTVVRDYRLAYFGPPSSTQLTTEQAAAAFRAAAETTDAICAAVEAGEWDAALKLYRQALPVEAGKGAEYAQLLRQLDTLRELYPNKYAWPPLALSNLHWKGILICAPVEVVLVGAAWLIWPPAYPVAAVLVFAYWFLLAVGVGAWPRAHGWWRKLLWLAPALLVIAGSEGFLHTLGGSWRTWGPPVLGGVCGLTLMTVGLMGEAGRALQKKLRAAMSRGSATAPSGR